MEKLRYERTGGGVHRHKGKKIIKGDVVSFYPGEVSDKILRQYTCLDKPSSPSHDLNVPPYLQQDEDGKYDIIHGGTGKKINSVSLTQREANKFGDLEIKKYKTSKTDKTDDEGDDDDIFDLDEDDEDED